MYPGTMLLFHPIYNEAAYRLRDKDLRDACCGVVGSCQTFFDRRPIISSENYSSPVVGMSSCTTVVMIEHKFTFFYSLI